MGHGHSRSAGGSRGGTGRAGYKSHKKTSRILLDRKLKLQNKRKHHYIRGDWLLNNDLLPGVHLAKARVVKVITRFKILGKAVIKKYYSKKKLGVKFIVGPHQ